TSSESITFMVKGTRASESRTRFWPIRFTYSVTTASWTSFTLNSTRWAYSLPMRISFSREYQLPRPLPPILRFPMASTSSLPPSCLPLVPELSAGCVVSAGGGGGGAWVASGVWAGCWAVPGVVGAWVWPHAPMVVEKKRAAATTIALNFIKDSPAPAQPGSATSIITPQIAAIRYSVPSGTKFHYLDASSCRNVTPGEGGRIPSGPVGLEIIDQVVPVLGRCRR